MENETISYAKNTFEEILDGKKAEILRLEGELEVSIQKLKGQNR